MSQRKIMEMDPRISCLISGTHWYSHAPAHTFQCKNELSGKRVFKNIFTVTHHAVFDILGIKKVIDNKGSKMGRKKTETT